MAITFTNVLNGFGARLIRRNRTYSLTIDPYIDKNSMMRVIAVEYPTNNFSSKYTLKFTVKTLQICLRDGPVHPTLHATNEVYQKPRSRGKLSSCLGCIIFAVIIS